MSKKHDAVSLLLELQGTFASGKVQKQALERINRLMSSIKRVGFLEHIPLNGAEGRYFIIDGHSWQNACRDLHMEAESSFVLWEETDFLSFLKSQVANSEYQVLRLDSKESITAPVNVG